MKHVFERQVAHLVLLGVLVAGAWAVLRTPSVATGSLWGATTVTWFWLSVAVAAGHQVFVAACWRLELHLGVLRRGLGASGFRLYAAGFAVWFALRVFTLIGLAEANRGTLAVHPAILQGLAVVFAIPVVYLIYSLARFFTFRRAVGIDHFDPSYRDKQLVRKGIFRITPNAMYTFGLLVLWLPGLLAASKAALLAAGFSHLYIWVHYLCTELPDMRRIYGEIKE